MEFIRKSVAASLSSSSSSSSSPPTNTWNYDVFLSFRGADTRQTFTDHLYASLHQIGIKTFMNDNQRSGDEISPMFLKAIEESRISIIIFSENYASSPWCLDELVKILECKESQKQIVMLVFYKVNPSDVGKQTSTTIKEAFGNYEHRFEVDKVSRWKTALTEAANIPGKAFMNGHESELVHDIVAEISLLVLKRTYLKVARFPVGIDSRVQKMDELLELGLPDVRVICVRGNKGIGKTTIAKAVYNAIGNKFDGCCFLNNVGKQSKKPGGLVQLQKILLNEILGEVIEAVDTGTNLIERRFVSKKVLLVLDHVNELRELRNLVGKLSWFGPGSRIIITTSYKGFLTADHYEINHVYEVKNLDHSEAFQLFSYHSFPESKLLENYTQLASKLVPYARGDPVALIVMGSFLCGRRIEEWEAMLHSYKRAPMGSVREILKITKEAQRKEEKKRRREENEVSGTRVLQESGMLLEVETHAEETGQVALPADNVHLTPTENAVSNGTSEVNGREVSDQQPGEGLEEQESPVGPVISTGNEVNLSANLAQPGLEEQPNPQQQTAPQEGPVNPPGNVGTNWRSLVAKIFSKVKNSFDHHEDFVEWMFFVASLTLEILSILCDQFFSPTSPQYAPIGMWFAVLALLVCVWELLCKCSEVNVRFDISVLDIFGLFCAISQCASSAVRYACLLRNIDNPFRVNLLPVIFLVCLGVSRIMENRRRSSRYAGHETPMMRALPISFPRQRTE